VVVILAEMLESLIQSFGNRYVDVLKDFFIPGKPNAVGNGKNHLNAFFVSV
jgi:hypothetical protein